MRCVDFWCLCRNYTTLIVLLFLFMACFMVHNSQQNRKFSFCAKKVYEREVFSLTLFLCSSSCKNGFLRLGKHREVWLGDAWWGLLRKSRYTQTWKHLANHFGLKWKKKETQSVKKKESKRDETRLTTLWLQINNNRNNWMYTNVFTWHKWYSRTNICGDLAAILLPGIRLSLSAYINRTIIPSSSASPHIYNIYMTHKQPHAIAQKRGWYTTIAMLTFSWWWRNDIII